MKMINRTSMTSTSGVTLMSPSRLSSSSLEEPNLNAIAVFDSWALGEVPLGQIDELESEVLELGTLPPDATAEVVETDERGDRRAETRRGVDQRLRDAGRDRDDRGRALEADVAERHHDSPDRAEQS